MKPFQPVFLKTYGKQSRKLSAWISSEDRKQAFDSSVSTDGSVFEPPKPTKKRERKTVVKKRRAARPAKEKALQCLTEKSLDEGNESNGENVVIPWRAQPTRSTREKKDLSGKTVAKRKAIQYLTETSSDKENNETASTSPAQTSPRSKMSRKAERGSVEGTLVQEGERKMSKPKHQRKSVKRKAEFGVHPPSVGRFVTRRRRTLQTKPKLPVVSLLSSSDDFTSDFYSRKLQRLSRKKPLAFVTSSAENSLNVAGTSSFAANPLQELSLNELTDRSLKLRPRKPMFCSTPSTGSFFKQRSKNTFPLKDHSTTPPSLAVSCIRDWSPSQEDLVAATVCEEKQQNEPELHHHREASVDVFMDPVKRSTREGSQMKNGVDLPSVFLLSTDSADTSQFVSAAGGLEWLIEALKAKCLTKRCTVRMERLDASALSHLCGRTTYSSCLEHSSSVHNQHNNEQAQCLQSSFHLELSASNILTSDHSQAEDDLEDAASLTHLETSPAAGRQQSAAHSSAQESMEQSESELYGGSTRQHTDSSFGAVMDTHSPSSNALSTLVTREEATAVKRKCSVQVQKQSKGSQQQTGSQDGKKFDEEETNDSKGCSAQISEKMSSFRKSPEKASVKNTAKITALIKEKCVTNPPTVNVLRLTPTYLKKTLQVKDASSKPTAVSPTNSGHLMVSDSNGDVMPSRKKASVAPKGKKRRSTSTDRPGTARKACVSGMSVSRWQNKSSATKQMFRERTAPRGHAKTADCSIAELMSKQHKQPQELLAATMNFSTPLRASQLNLSSLLADLTPSTPTWSRLKAALSVHRKVLLTPKSSATTSPVRMKLGDLSQDLFSMTSRTPLSRHQQSQLRSLHSLVVCEDEDLSDTEKVCAECGQQKPLPWEECILPTRMKRCVKIGEGTFGEVFSTTNASGETVALKIIPVEGAEKVNGEDQKTFGEILHEIIISKELSSLKEKQQNQTHGFIGLNDLHCVQGCYPPDFLNAWDKFDQRKGSENDRPDFFEKDQLFIILEFEFGGIDLENSNGTLSNLVVAKSILHQVTAALSVAEQELHFEHRDLHWGNVLVKTTKQKTGSFILNGATHRLETSGVLVRIIDYSLSRLEIDDLTVSCDISNDEELFMGKGDYQFDIYRLMRHENGNNWSSYHPHTNVLWLHYLCSKLLSMKYRNSGGRGAKDVRKELTRFHDNVLQYSSAMEVLQNCPMFQ